MHAKADEEVHKIVQSIPSEMIWSFLYDANMPWNFQGLHLIELGAAPCPIGCPWLDDVGEGCVVDAVLGEGSPLILLGHGIRLLGTSWHISG